MQKVFAVIALVIVLAMPVGAQSLGFLTSLMKAVVEEYGIETVIGVLEELGYIGEGEVAVNENVTEPTTVNADELTVRSAVWDDVEGEEVLVYMVVSDDAFCYSYIEWGRGTQDTLAKRMKWRQRFINRCIRQ